VTVFSNEPKKRNDGETDRIDVTQPDQLEAMLSETLGQDRATAIMGSIQPLIPPPRSPLELYIKSLEGGGANAMSG
jgi:hypothetical protein